MASTYLTEDEALARWPMLDGSALRRARRHKELTFYAFPSGPRYTVADVEDYIARKYKRCADLAPRPQQTIGGTMEPITSTALTQSEADLGTPAGMTPEVAQSTAEVFAQRILSRQSKSSSCSPLSHPSQQTKLPAHATS